MGCVFVFLKILLFMIFNKWLISFILWYNFFDMGVKIMLSILVIGVYDI